VDEGYMSLRLPPTINIHKDSYCDKNLPDEIDSYDQRRDAQFSIPKEKQRLTEIYGVANFYGWSEDKSRQVSTTERDQLAAYLTKRGFNLE
jgi:nitroreductase/FMN reductase [NAD(P)H]